MSDPHATRRPLGRRRLIPAVMGLVPLTLAAACSLLVEDSPPSEVQLVGFARLPAATFAPGPTSGTLLGTEPIHQQELPFTDAQPVQGFSALLDNGDGTFLAMSDNGFGALENSADYILRVYTLRTDWKTPEGGSGAIEVTGYIELRDPDRLVPFAITNHFTDERVLTGADFDIESMQRAPDGSLWFGDEFGPFLLHTDATGKLLDAPIPLPDVDRGEGAEIRSPQNPFNEEASAVRIMNAVHAHAQRYGNPRTPVFSPSYVLLKDDDETTFVSSREESVDGAGVSAASSEIFDVKSLHDAGYPIVPWTVDDSERMTALMTLGVDGLISDRPDLLWQAVKNFDADGDGKPGDFLVDGLIDVTRFDAQGHRGGRDLRPENTLPAFEVALDNLMTTLELDTGISLDLVPVVSHDPHIQAQKCRHANGQPYETADEVLIKDKTVAEIQSTFICDKVFRGPQQLNDPALSPVATQFAQAQVPARQNPYFMPTLTQVFQFVSAYVEYYKTGAGMSQPEAALRWKNAERVRFNIETKINPRAEFADRTIGPTFFADTVATTIKAADMMDRADIQSFDFRTLLYVHEHFPEIRTVHLFGDFPIFDDTSLAGSDDGTNLQDEHGANTPWLGGLFWPYRQTQLTAPFRAQASGGFEGMALSADGTRLYPMLEKPLSDADEGDNRVIVYDFDLATKAYTGVYAKYPLDKLATSACDFVMIDATRGLVIERDNKEGKDAEHKAVFEVTLAGGGAEAKKELVADLLRIKDPNLLGGPAAEGDIGFGTDFAFPFITTESVVLLSKHRIGLMNDNNYPFSMGRHIGSDQPDDSEFILLDVGRDLMSP